MISCLKQVMGGQTAAIRNTAYASSGASLSQFVSCASKTLKHLNISIHPDLLERFHS